MPLTVIRMYLCISNYRECHLPRTPAAVLWNLLQSLCQGHASHKPQPITELCYALSQSCCRDPWLSSGQGLLCACWAVWEASTQPSFLHIQAAPWSEDYPSLFCNPILASAFQNTQTNTMHLVYSYSFWNLIICQLYFCQLQQAVSCKALNKCLINSWIDGRLSEI